MDDATIKDILGALLTHLNLSFDDIVVSKEEDITRVDITSTDASRIIGWHGETLNSVQHLLKSIIRRRKVKRNW